MDKRRSEGSSRERSRTNTIAPKRIANSDAFLDASRDPRLNNDKYRAQMMSNKSRVSPDTTITTMASKNGPSKVDKVDKADLNQGGLGQTSQISVNKNACFACAMCPSRLFDTIDKVRVHVEDEHSISVKEIVDKLIKLPATNYLRSFRCVACPASASSSIGTSEEELKVHFKEKHKINTVKPFLIKRICRICDYDKSTSNDQLVKHITDEHPRSDYGDEDEDDQDEANEEASNNDEYEPYEPEEELDYEPKPESPAPVVSRDRSRDQRDYEASSVPEDGELSAEESRRRSRKRSRSVSSNSSQSSHESKIKVKPRKYRDSSSSSADSRLGRRKKASSVSPESSSKRKVYIKNSAGSKVVDRKKPQSPARVAPTSSTSGTAGKEVFGLYYTPPGGFCEECNERYDKGEGAQRHYKSKAHFFNTKNKYRCYFCNAYVQDTKGHLESRHRDMTFQCQLNGCNHPRFTQAAKVIDHVRCNHSREFKRTNKDMDLFRKKMISMPRNIMSFTCKQCRIVFHGDVKIAIVHLVLEHGQNVPQRNDFVFQCRICGPRALFDNERQLESHCKMHLDEVSRGASRSPSSDRSSVDRGRSRSRSRSRSYSPRFQGGGGRPEGGRPGSGDRRPGSGDRESGGNRGGAKSILRCHFCTDEFRTLAVRKNHMLRDHRELLFECALCTFANMYRRDLVWHLREHHRKEHGFSDGQLVKEFVHMPKDLRKIICIKCSETEAHENAVWLAVDPNEDTSKVGYPLSVIRYWLSVTTTTAELQHLLLFVVISVVIIILYFLTPVIIITPHYNYSATTYHDLACYMMPSYGDLTEKNYLLGTLSQIIYKPMIHYGI